jgi:hypothetical protein
MRLKTRVGQYCDYHKALHMQRLIFFQPSLLCVIMIKKYISIASEGGRGVNGCN